MSVSRKVAVRLAVDSDLDEVASIWRASAMLMDGLPRDVPSQEALRNRIDAELGSGWDLRVATVGGRIAGFLAARPVEAFLDQIFVTPSEQGRGVGSALMDAAKQLMAAELTLRMDAQNEVARRFYLKHGMNLVSRGVHPSTGIPVHFYGWKAR